MYSPRRTPQYSQSAVYGGAGVSTPALLGQVLGITGIGFVLTAVAAYLFRGLPFMFGWIAMLVGFFMVVGISRSRTSPAVALMWFYAFTFLEGVGIAPTISHYVRAIGTQPVVDAAVTTGFGMVVLGLVSYTFGLDWRRFSNLAFGALIGLIVVGLISAFTHFIHPQVYAWATLAVFTLLTLIDFSRIRAGGGGANPVQLALSIYLDGINIFLAFLELFGMRRGNN